MKMRARPPKPVNIARKVNLSLKQNKEYVSFLKDFENNPLHYFTSKFNNKPFIIGQSFSQSPSSKESDLSFSNIRALKSGMRKKNTAKVAKTFAGGDHLKTYITDNDLALIYEHADQRMNVSETEEDLSQKVPINCSHHLKQQENSLKAYKNSTRKRMKLSAFIRKKINGKINTLLMDKQELFRPKKELLDCISYDGSNSKAKFEFNLRLPNDNHMQTRNEQRRMRENSDGKIAHCQPKEIIRNPSYDLLCNNPLSNNSHLKERFSSVEAFNRAVNTPNMKMRQMYVKGANLLQCEKSIARQLKGQKVLYKERRSRLSLGLPLQAIVSSASQFPLLKLRHAADC